MQFLKTQHCNLLNGVGWQLGVGDIIVKIIDSRYISIFTTYRQIIVIEKNRFGNYRKIIVIENVQLISVQ